MKPRFFTKTFIRFFLGFLAIIAVAFGIILIASDLSAPQTQPVDNIAQP
jgi:hypothetical protein